MNEDTNTQPVADEQPAPIDFDSDTPLCPMRKPGDDSDICESCQ
jgi:hypothetical protein